MFREVDPDKWERKSTFEFFKDFEDPFFNITANLNVGRLYDFCKSNGLAFSLASLFYSLETANEIREFRLRIVDGNLVEFDRVDANQTILNDDNTFSFGHFEFTGTVFEFDIAGKAAREKYLNLRSLDVEKNRADLIYYSVIPWISFTSFKHASRINKYQTVPRIVFGKMFDDNGMRKMPLSVEVHHAMMDGFHVGKFFNLFQEKIDSL